MLRKPHFLVLGFLALSCSKNSDQVTPALCYLATIEYPDSGNANKTISETYLYNDKHQVTTVSYTTLGFIYLVNSYNYDSNGRLLNINGDDGTVTTYTYLGSNISRLDTKIGMDTYSVIYSYDNKGRIASATYSFNGTKSGTNIYAYPNETTRNFGTETNISNDGTSLGVTKYEYDTNPLPYFPSSTENNITKKTFSNGAYTCISTYSYNYNSNGYPISSTKVDSRKLLGQFNFYIYV